MRLFGGLYDRALAWAGHRHARWYLGGLSFAESSFFPIPPDVMLAPMTLVRPSAGWQLAFITTAASVLGGVAGWMIGYFAIDWATPLLQDAGYWDNYVRVQAWFERWGFAAVLVAGFSPVPYKLFTIAAGTLGMFLPLFVLASLLGRGARFFLVAGLIIWGGARMEQTLRRNVEVLGWLAVAAVVLLVLLAR